MIQIFPQVVKYITTSALLAFALSVSFPVLAQDPFVGSGSNTTNPNTFSGGLDAVKNLADTNKLSPAKSTKEILQTITKWLLSLIGTIAVISLLYGGYLYITSQGDEGSVEKAKHIILYSIIGIIVIGLSAIIVNVVITVATT